MGTNPSSTPPAATPAAPDGSRRRFWRKLAKRWLVAAAGVMLVLLVIFLLLPIWISNEQGRSYILQRVNRDLAGTLDIKRWSVSWWHGMELDELTLTLPNGRRVAHCPHIQTELTLWSLLCGSYDVGNARLPNSTIALTKYADGTTDIGRLFSPPGSPRGNGLNLRSLRRAIQITGSELTIASERSSRAITLTEFSAELTIASPIAPFYLRVRGLAGGPAGRPVSCDAVLPALSRWPAAWEILSGLDLTASELPTAVVADWVGLGPGWEQALGPDIDTLRFQSEGVGGGSATSTTETRRGSWMLSLQIRGTGGTTWADAKLLCTASAGQTRLSLPEELKLNPRDPSAASLVRDFRCAASLNVSPPVREILRRVNPVLGGLQKTSDVIGLRVQSLDVALEPAATGGTMLAAVTIPAGELASAGLLRQIAEAGGKPDTAPSGAPAVSAAFGPLIIRLDGQELLTDHFTLSTRSRALDQLSFSGHVNLDGKLSMTVARTRVGGSAGGGLGTSTIEMPITGTIDDPHLAMP